ncbi:hypothetical protein ACGFXC_37445 [Streptomyces sp. NPDC048507]|uniref:hypothetical protein n=1 Tax=Streptomyces sp. NPDC048507 TaxID=3365560 RepID=UPI003722313D
MVGAGYLTLATAGAVLPLLGDALLVSRIGAGAFAVYGIALTVAARSYGQRTRPSPRAGDHVHPG